MPNPQELELSGSKPGHTHVVVVLDRQQINYGKDPATGLDVVTNRVWIRGTGKDHKKQFIPGAILIEQGQSGGPELEIIAQEAYDHGKFVRAFARDPRPLNLRGRQRISKRSS